MSDFNPMPEVNEYLDNYKRYLETGVGLYIQGDPGHGKTHLSCAIVKELIRRYQIKTVHITKFSQIILRLQDAFENPNVSGLKVIEEIAAYDLLVIDDLGKEHVTDWSRKHIHHIIDKRYEELKPIIFTSIFPFQNLSGDVFLKDTMGRVAETTLTVTMNLKNRRGA